MFNQKKGTLIAYIPPVPFNFRKERNPIVGDEG